MGPKHRFVRNADIVRAAGVIRGDVHRTPVVSSRFLSEVVGARVFLKLELFQKTGSFKVRGVLNKLRALPEAARRKGVITLSAGNHAQALAWAAGRSGIPATVVMPEGSVKSKVEATRGYGGEVVLTGGDLLDACLSLQRERNLVLVHPFDDLDVIAGQGTVGLEILEDVPGVDTVIVGVGGGGLISGVSAAVKSKAPRVKIVGVEPAGAPGMSRSLAADEPLHLDHVDTVADGLAAPFVGSHTLAHTRAFVDEVVIVSDEEILHAMREIMDRCKVLAEPAACAGVAALRTGRTRVRDGATVVCVLSGGNIDAERLKSLL